MIIIFYEFNRKRLQVINISNIIDNTKGNELVKVIKEELKKAKEVKFAIGYFFLSGFSLVKDDFPTRPQKFPFLKIVMGNETTYSTKEELVAGYTLRDAFKQKMLEELQQKQLSEKEKERIKTLRDLIARNIIDVKLFDKSKMHAKLYLFLTRPEEEIESPGLAIVGSSNFTAEGLTKNKELNVLLTSRSDVVYLNEWFDKLWEEAIDFNEDLLKVIEWSGIISEGEEKYPKIGKYIDPLTLFKYLVYQWFGERIVHLTKKDVLMEFQLVGVLNAVDKINKYDGVILADSVGLGKSYMASAIIEEFINRKHPDWLVDDKIPSVLLILPPSIISQWEELLFKQDLSLDKSPPFFAEYQKKCIKDKGNDKEWVILDSKGKIIGKIRLLSLGIFQSYKVDDQSNYIDPRLEELAEEYDLIVIDEAHKYRNKNTNRWKAVRKLQRKKENSHHNKFILLTATPLNNTIIDILNLIRLFMNDTFYQFRAKGVNVPELIGRYKELKKKLREKEDDKLKSELKELSLEIKEKILDEIMVLRTRRYVKEQFKDLKINGKPLIFKDPIPYSLDYSLFFTQEYSDLIKTIKEKIDHLNFEYTKLYGSRFVVFEEENIDSEEPEKKYIEIADLFKLLLGKRLESGIYPFETTLKRIYEKEKIFTELFRQQTEIITNKKDLEELIKEAIEKANIMKDLEELEEEYEIEEDKDWLSRVIATLTEYGKEELSNEEDEQIILRAGIEKAIRKLTQDLSLMDEIFDVLDKLKEKESLGQLPKEKGDVIQVDIYKYKNDPKLNALLQIIGPQKHMTDKLMVPNLYGKKILIFTQYRDTAYYLYTHLKHWVEKNPEVQRWLKSNGKSKIGLVTGDTDMSAKINYIKRFAPLANDGREEVEKYGEIDILISTDSLSEGVNLQDADAVINFDLPWNPMIIVQRVGRVNRIGNDKDVVVINFVPFEELEVLVGVLRKLKEKIEDITLIVGKETKILSPEEEISVETFGEKIKEISTSDITKLEEMGISTDFKQLLPEGIPKEQLDEYKLLNIIQYDLNLTNKDFEEIRELNEPPYYSFITGNKELISVWKFFRGDLEIDKVVYIIKENGEIEKTTPLRFLDLIRKTRKTPQFVESVMDNLGKMKEKIENDVEFLKENYTQAQKGFLAELRKALLRKRDEVSEGKRKEYASIVNSLPLLPPHLYSREIKKFLTEQSLIEDKRGRIEVKEVNEVIDKLAEFLKAKGLDPAHLSNLDVSVKFIGWYYEG